MRRIVFSSLAAIAILSGCNQPKADTAPQQKQESVAHTIVFLLGDTGDKRISLSSNDMFATGVLTDEKGKKHNLKRAASASGIMLTNDEGIELLFKRGEGVYTPGKGKKDIPVTGLNLNALKNELNLTPHF